ncbi:MAG: hypothetical protein LAO03_22890 [Acidobacteriia bacterium]|nr:hypothetical protein [Terriglobia bacterium]
MTTTRTSILSVLYILFLCLGIATNASAQATEEVLYTFTGGTDGGWPQAGLAFDNQGNLYGTTNSFGPNGYGTVFQLTPSGGGWTKTTIHGFCVDAPACRDGAYPLAGVTVDAAGNLYGTTSYGGGPQSWGVVYQLSPSAGTWDFTRIRNFSHADSYPSAKVTLDRAGRLFGTTLGNPVAGGLGTVFELVPNQNGGWNHRTLHDFQGQGGPITAVAIDRAHNLYGMNDSGPDEGLFQVSPNRDGTWTLKTIAHLFGSGDLILDAAGNLYGTASGVVFKLTHTTSAWIQTVLYTFGPNDGGNHSGLTSDAAGNLYGTSGNGGLAGCANAYGCGLVFKLTPAQNGWIFSILYKFTGGVDGGNPVGGVVVDNAGNLYGATNYGGLPGGCLVFGCGVVYKITP